jgi:hypothetical protein
MTGTHYRARFVSLRRLVRWIAALDVLACVALTIFVATRPHITMFVTVVSIVAALVIVLLAVGLRIGFRNLPELEQLSAKFDDEAAEDRNQEADAHEGAKR